MLGSCSLYPEEVGLSVQWKYAWVSERAPLREHTLATRFLRLKAAPRRATGALRVNKDATNSLHNKITLRTNGRGPVQTLGGRHIQLMNA